MSNSIESRVATWSKSAESRVYDEALEDFQSDSTRVPTDYAKLSARSFGKWGAIYSAFWTAKKNAKKVKASDLGIVGKNYHLVKTGTQAEIDAMIAGVKAEEAANKVVAEESGTAYTKKVDAIVALTVEADSLRVADVKEQLKAIKAWVAKQEKALTLVG